MKVVFDLVGVLLFSLGLFLIAEKPGSISNIDLMVSPEILGILSIAVGIGTIYVGYRRSDSDSFLNYLVHRLLDWIAA